MLRVLAKPRWLGALALAAVFASAAFFLGRWQWGRYEERAARADRITAHYDAAPVPLAEVAGAQPLPRELEWTRVRATGRYAAQDQLLVRNRPLQGTYGYEVVVPLVLADGSAVLVDRGWVPNAPRADVAPTVPAVPAGPVEVTGWLRPSERSLDRQLPAGQLASVNLAEAAAQTGTRLVGGYLVLESEDAGTGAVPPRPEPLERPDTDLGSHQAYALQWWGSMPVGFVLVFLGARREHLDAGGGRPGPRSARPKKVRVWDEEDT